MKVEFSQNSVATYTFFRDNIYYPKSVFYPSSGADASPAKVFSRVVFLDAENGNEGCVQALRDAGFEAIKSDVREYVPKEEHDLLILQNPVVPAIWSTPYLKVGGYIIANDYHGSASELANLPGQFTLLCGLNTKNGKVTMERNLEGYFTPVESLEDYRRCRPNNYEFTMGVVENFVAQGIINCKPTDRIEHKFKVYLEEMQEGMPSKKTADDYVFIRR